MKEENLIFIISQPRSGSTYLQNLLSNNSVTNTCSESWLLLNFANQIKPGLIQAKFDNQLTKEAFQDYIKKFPDLDFPKRQKQFLLDLYQPLFNGHQFVIDKTPRYWEILNEILELFPKSKIIMLKRNPLDVAKSMMTTWNVNSMKKLNYYKRDLLCAPKKMHTFLEKNLTNKNVYSLRYEDLIQNKGREVHNLYSWLKIDFDESVLETQNNYKFKGRFGDPFLNSEKGYKVAKADLKKKNLSARDKEFLKGYVWFLGEQFFLEYGNYSTEKVKGKKTLAFAHFLHLCAERSKDNSLKKELKYLLKDRFFRLFE